MRTAFWSASAFALVLVASSLAAPVTGTLNIAGAASVTSQSIDFLPAGTGVGAWVADPSAQSGSFAAFVTGAGSIKDFGQATVTVGTPFSLPNFIVFPAAPQIDLQLTGISPGVFGSAALFLPAALGQTATPPASEGNFASMYNMVNLPGPSAILAFVAAGLVVDTSTGDTTPLTGNFTMQFAGLTMQDVWGALSSGGSVSASYSASFAAIPEPATVVLLLAGTLAIVRCRGLRH